jgi:hypothetical protein
MRQFLVLSLITAILLGATTAAHLEERTVAVRPVSPTGSTLQPVLTTTEFRVGQNQVAFGLFLNYRTFIANADVVVRLYARDDQRPQARTEVRAFYTPFDLDARVARDALSDGMSPVEMEGVYVAQVLFDRPGTWVLEAVIVQEEGPLEVARSTIEVLAPARPPALETSARP